MHEPSIHSSIILTRGGVWGQAIGIPTPPGMIAYIPKYVECGESTPWRHLSRNLCRIIPSYGPRGLEKVMNRLGHGWRLDPVYGAVMPYVLEEELLLFIHPREAMYRLVSQAGEGLELVVEVVWEVARGTNVPLWMLGLTGSYAAGIFHAGSDVDLIAYGWGSAVKMYEYFRENARGPSSEDLGGVTVYPDVDLSWRRGVFKGYSVTWTGAPSSWHCPPLKDYYSISPPVERVEARIHVEPEQAGALLYPPCVQAGDYWIVSYEYNIGGILYEGGVLHISALSSSDDVLFIGLREYPGLIRRLPPSR